MVEPLGLEDLEPRLAQLVHHLAVRVLVVVVGVDEPGLLEPAHPGVGGVEGEVAAGRRILAAPDQDALGLLHRDVLDALAAVDEVERPVGVLRQVRHRVVVVRTGPSSVWVTLRATDSLYRSLRSSGGRSTTTSSSKA